MTEAEISETDIAIVGMSGRFPGAGDVDELWRRVAAGDDCLVDLDAADLIDRGVPSSIVRDPDRVLRDGRLDDVAGFDREFFGIGARDAAIMDPQHRHFLECSWEALESAAVAPERFDGAIGVFAGCGMNTYLLENLLTNPDLLDDLGWFLLRHTGNDKDFLATGLSYRLGLRGPSVNVQTACSTSLVAVHLGVQSLLSFESDLVLAGGVTIEFPHATGYTYREGEILSASGRCRAFDAASDGTVLTGGVAVVALRRLTDALDDGDPILAVVKGSAVNNDGERKVGFLAPSVDGHADVVREAVTVADVDVDTIGLLEAHGTGTAVGDPIEVAALTEAFRSGTDATGFCRLTSTKPNIGHLDTAAGGASLIKAVQALRHRTLPPLANHTGASPLIDLDRSPFVVSGSASPWPDGSAPRRAGVSSLGVGGTNAHVVVEEAPELPALPAGRPGQPILLSGLSRAAVDDAAERLARFFEQHPDADPADVAHTLVAGRRHMPVRRAVAITDAASAPAELRDDDRRRRHVAETPESAPPVVFTFPGGGAQYVGMANALDDRFDVFHRVRRQGIELVRQCGGADLEPLLAPDASPDDLRRPTASLPAVFVTSVALARQWMAFGITPDSMIGHSLGEYVAAHLAGVMSFDDAVSLVVTRSALMEQASGDDAAMLVVPLSVDEVTDELPPDLSLATVNADDECVVAGRLPAVEAYAAALRRRGVEAAQIPLAAAAHSALLDPVLDEFDKAVRAVSLQAPQLPYVSNLTGDWVTADQVTDPQYWVDHLRGTVRFSDGLRTVLGPEGGVVVELGPGGSLSSYARRSGAATGTIPVLRHPDDLISDTNHAITAIARLWTYGVDVDLSPFIGADRRRLRLPTYAFQHETCWIEPGAGRSVAVPEAPSLPTRIDDPDRMTWRPAWRRAEREPADGAGAWLVVGTARADEIADEIAGRGLSVMRAERYEGLPDGVDSVVLTAGSGFDANADVWLDQARRVASDLGGLAHGRLVAATTGAWNVDDAAAEPAGALAAGVVLVAPREYPDLVTVQVDDDETTDVGRVVDEALTGSGIVALRSDERWVPTIVHEPVGDDEGTGFRHGGTYVVTGGLGGVGALLAERLATEHDAALVLVTSSALPDDADGYLATHAPDDSTSRRLARLARLRAVARSVEVVVADLDDATSIDHLLDEAERRSGSIDGVVHAAGRLHDQLLDLADSDGMRSVVGPKAAAAHVLADRLGRRGGHLLVLVSSTSTWLAPAGQAAYVGANAVLDAMAGTHPTGLRVVTIGFGVWATTGMAADAAVRRHVGGGEPSTMTHPVLAEALTRPDRSVTCWGRLSTAHHWLVDEHRTADGTPIVPGTGHLELMITALRAAGVDEPGLTDIALIQPLIVPDESSVQVRVVVDGPDAATRSVRVESSDGSGDWTTCSEAAVGTRPPAEAFDRSTFDRSSDREIDPMSAGRAHLRLGRRWQLTLDARRGEAAAVGSIATADVESELAAWSAHPAVVDLATGWAIALDDSDHGTELHVPVGYERVSWWAPVPDDPTIVAVRRSATDAEFLRADVTVLDGDRPCLRIEGIQLRAVDEDRLGSATAAATGRVEQPSDLLDLAAELGLRPDETLPIVDRVVASPNDRMIISAVDLDELARFALTEPAVPDDAAEAGPSTGTVEDRLQALWRSILGTDDIGPDDDFFDLGGHSLIAIRLLNQVKDEFGVRLQLSAMFEASTVASMAQVIRSHGVGDTADAEPAASSTPHIIPINRAGERRPFFVVHGAGGSVLFLWTLARALGAERPLFGFQAEGVNEGELPDSTIESMAARYVDELRRHSPGPYLLGGYSGGGIVALEMARQLQEAGEEVDHVVLFDSVPQGESMVPIPQRWLRTLANVRRHGLGPVKPYLRERTVQSLRRYVPERQHRRIEREEQERALGLDPDGAGAVNLFYYFAATADRYELGTYDVDVTVIKADLVWPSQPDDYHWSDRISGRLDLLTTPGDHHSMFFPEFASSLAERVRATLDPFDEADR